jgi:hypothetical protein
VDSKTFAIQRGDLIAWPVEHVTTYAHTLATTVTTTWEIGIVTSVSRSGRINRIDTGRGTSVREEPDRNRALGVRADRYDRAAAKRWLDSPDRYPWKAGTAPLGSADDVRELVRTWLVN